MSEAATLDTLAPADADATPAPLADRILRAIAKATSARPANAGDVAAIVGGPEADYWAELERLLHDRRVASAHITKPPAAPYIAIWPTGVVTPLARLDGDALSWMFVRHELRLHEALHATTAPRCRPVVITDRPPRHPAAPAATPKEIPVITARRRNRDELKAALLSAVAGRGPNDAKTVAEIRAAAAPDVPRPTINGMLDRLFDCDAIARRACRGPTGKQFLYFDASLAQPDTATTASRAAMAAASLGAIADAIPSMEPEPDPAHEDPPALAAPVRFALLDSGVLAIHDDDTVLEIPPPDVARLARLLGVPHNTTPV